MKRTADRTAERNMIPNGKSVIPLHHLGPFRKALTGILSVLFWGSVQAQPPTYIEPQGASDWTIVDSTGVIHPFVAIDTLAASRVWKFRMDALESRTTAMIAFRLDFSDFGIPPQPRRNCEYLAWKWYVVNQETAGRVTLSLVTEAGEGLTMPASHANYDYQGEEVFAPHDSYTNVDMTISERIAYQKDHNKTVPDLSSPIVAVVLNVFMPHDQTIYLGDIRFGPARKVPRPPHPRRRKAYLAPGRFIPADLDGDGRIELLAPWNVGPKIWAYDREAHAFQLDVDRGVELQEPIYLMVPVDLDHDGDQDIVAMQPSGTELLILENQRGGFRGRRQDCPLPNPEAKPTILVVTDDNHDDHPDILIAYHLQPSDGTPRIFRMAGLGPFSFEPPAGVETAVCPMIDGIYYMGAAPMDGDDHIDLIAGAPGTGIHVFPGNGDGTYRQPVEILPLPSGAVGDLRAVQLADLTGNGYPDLYYAQYNSAGDQSYDSSNHFVENLGGFRFKERPASGLHGGLMTRAACLADADGRPGLELLTLEHEGVYVQTLDHPGSGTVSAPELVAPRSGTGRFLFAHDLDGNGRLDVVVAEESAERIVPLVLHDLGEGGSGVVVCGGPGKRNWGPGAVVLGRGWSMPLMANSLGSALSLTVSGMEAVRLKERGRTVTPTPGVPVGLAEVTVLDRLRYRRHLLGEWLGTIPPGGPPALGLVILAGMIGGGGLFVLRRYRRLLREAETVTWRKLLRTVKITSHSGWRKTIIGLARRLQMNAPLEDIRSALPPEEVAQLEACVAPAARLKLDGSTSARRALGVLKRINSDGNPDYSTLEAACRNFTAAMDVITAAVRARFSCNPREVHERVRRQLADELREGVAIRWEGGDAEFQVSFPMNAEDLYFCLREMVRNALRKDPPPAKIAVAVHEVGTRFAALEVHDDGDTIQQERDRPNRSGRGQGLEDIRAVLEPYGGSFELTDSREGPGVRAILRVHSAE